MNSLVDFYEILRWTNIVVAVWTATVLCYKAIYNNVVIKHVNHKFNWAASGLLVCMLVFVEWTIELHLGHIEPGPRTMFQLVGLLYCAWVAWVKIPLVRQSVL